MMGRVDAGEPELPEDLPPSILASVGDAVLNLYVRARLAQSGCRRPQALHQAASRWTSAANQACLLRRLDAFLDPAERAIVRRGRNVSSIRGPRGVPVAAYRASTGLEALLGCLHLSGRTARLEEILRALWDAARGDGGGDPP